MTKLKQLKSIPNPLQKGDQIGLISTARKVSLSELNFSIKRIEEWGYKVVFSEYLFEQDNQFGGTDEQRAKGLQQMINNPEIKAILCVRGGYGTVKIIDNIDFSVLQKSPKWIMGYSDVTVLHSHLHQLSIASIHCSMPINFENNSPLSLSSIRSALKGEPIAYQTESHPLNINGKAKAQLIGGNLSILYSLCGSQSDIDTEGKILFLEDLDEYLYHIDRMITNLKRNNKLANLAGLIVGGMTKMHDNEVPYGKNANQIILDAVKEYTYPVCFDFPAGHLKNNLCLKFGVSANLEIGETTKLIYGKA
jgi:muramoyltetrapeptide carboxypeptidase